jgi:hypothetical protein
VIFNTLVGTQPMLSCGRQVTQSSRALYDDLIRWTRVSIGVRACGHSEVPFRNKACRKLFDGYTGNRIAPTNEAQEWEPAGRPRLMG